MKLTFSRFLSSRKTGLKTIGVFFFLLSFVFPVKAQGTLDSLKAELSISRSNKVSILLAIAQYFHTSYLDSSQFYAEQAWQIAKGNSEEIQLVNVYSEFGRIKLLMSSHEEALEYFLKAEEHAKQILPLPKDELIRINSNLGIIYERQGESEKSIQYLEKGLLLVDEVEKESPSIKNTVLYAALYNNMANAYLRLKDTTKAITYQRKGLEKALEADDYKQASSLYNNIGKLLIEQHKIPEAYPYVKKGLQLREQNHDELGVMWSYRNMGLYFLYANQLDSAKHFIHRALAINKKLGGLLDGHDQAYQILTSIYEKEGKYDKALEAYKLYILYKDSIYSGPKFKELARIEAKYEMLKKSQEELADRKSREFKNIITIAGLVFGLVTLSLLYGLQRYRSKNQELKYEQLQLREEKLLTERKTLSLELDYKRKDLTTHVLYLLKKDDLIHKIVQKLISLKKELASENQQKILKITRDLKNILGRTDNSWQEFELRFKEVHSDFYDTLGSKFPELTPKERRLCALLKLNMTTKEISSITHQSARSVDVARTRLRRKFNLTNSEVGLVDFLNKL